jgi:hypothetical protein
VTYRELMVGVRLLCVRCGLSSLPMSKELLNSLTTETDLNNFLRSVFPTPKKSKNKPSLTSKRKQAPAPERQVSKSRAAVARNAEEEEEEAGEGLEAGTDEAVGEGEGGQSSEEEALESGEVETLLEKLIRERRERNQRREAMMQRVEAEVAAVMREGLDFSPAFWQMQKVQAARALAAEEKEKEKNDAAAAPGAASSSAAGEGLGASASEPGSSAELPPSAADGASADEHGASDELPPPATVEENVAAAEAVDAATDTTAKEDAEKEAIVQLWMGREIRVMIPSLVQMRWVPVTRVEVREGASQPYLFVDHRGERQFVSAGKLNVRDVRAKKQVASATPLVQGTPAPSAADLPLELDKEAGAPVSAHHAAAATPASQRGAPRATPTSRAPSAAAGVAAAATPASQRGAPRATPTSRAPSAAAGVAAAASSSKKQASRKRAATTPVGRTLKRRKGKSPDVPDFCSIIPADEELTLASLAPFEGGCDVAVFEFMRTVVCKTPVRGTFVFSASVKAHKADSCAAGVAKQILKGPFVEATMHVSCCNHVCLVLCL